MNIIDGNVTGVTPSNGGLYGETKKKVQWPFSWRENFDMYTSSCYCCFKSLRLSTNVSIPPLVDQSSTAESIP